MALEINETNFEELVLKSETPVLIDFCNNFKIVVIANNELNDDEMLIVLRNFINKLYGYPTECPEYLKSAKVEVRHRI